MQKKSKIFGSIIGISILVFLITMPWLKVKPGETTIENPIDAAMAKDGGLRIVDQGGNRVLWLDASKKIDYIYETDEIINEIAVDEEGETYVRTQSEIEQSGKIKREAIYKLGKRGEKKLVYETVHEQGVLRPAIFQITGLGKGLKFAIRGKNRFSFYEATETGEIKQVLDIPYHEAENWIYKGLISPDYSKVYYLLHNGRIYSYDAKTGVDQLLYNGADYEKPEGVPKEITLDEEGNLYFSDLGFRDIGRIHKEEVSFFYNTRSLPKKEFLGQQNYESINAENGRLVGCSREAVYYLEEESPVALKNTEISIRALAGAMASKISLAVCCLMISYGILSLLKKLFQKAELMVKIIISLSISIAIMGALLVITVLPYYKKILGQELENRTKDVGYLVAKQIPLNNLENLNSVSDYRRLDYMLVKKAIDTIFNEQGLKDLYCVLYTVRDGILTVNYASGEDCGCFYPYDRPYEGSEEQKILETGQAKTYSGLESLEGSYSFSLTPITGENQKTAALLEIGVNTGQFEKNLEQMLNELILSIMIIGVVTVFLIVQIFRLAEYQDIENE